jgi:hypothetical protein
MTSDLDPPSPPTEPAPAPGWTLPAGAQPPAPQGWTPPQLAQPASGPKRRGIRWRWIVLAVVLVLVGSYWYQGWQQEQNYRAGHNAYLTTDCATAVGPLRRAADGEPGAKDSDVALKARAELEECEALLAADDLVTQGKHGDAVLAYRDIVTKYTRSPLNDAALASGQEAIASEPDTVATIGVCDALETLEAQQFIAEPSETLPLMLYACGQAYEAESVYDKALAVYARFRADYGDHALAGDVDAAYARATLAETEASGAGSLPLPEETGEGSGDAGVAKVIIRNDSPDALSMVFSGPDVRVEGLEACATCERFTGAGPEACPDKGPIGEYVVEPGTYDVVVKSGSGINVVPFRGTWTLKAGQEYASCFYIVTSAP